MSAIVHIKTLDIQYLKLYFYVFINKFKNEIMSTIKGPFDFTGSFGNMRVYDDPGTGKRILSGKGGPSIEQFHNLPSMQPARENASEFGASSHWASLLYDSLTALKHLMHSRCFNKITSKGKFILRQDFTSTHGFRMVGVSKEPQALTEIDFNERHPFKSVIRENYVISLSEDKKTLTLTIPDFVTARDAWWGNKYYAVRIYVVVAQTADMVYNPVTKEWEPTVDGLELISRKVVSGWMFYNSESNDVNLSVSLDDPAFSSPGTVVFVAMGVEFALSVINGEPYPEPHCGSMSIVKSFNV
jgi:hypothetical protein